jgi:hypothetical protein
MMQNLLNHGHVAASGENPISMQTGMKGSRVRCTLLFDLSESYDIDGKSAPIYDSKENDLGIDELSPKCAQFEISSDKIWQISG